MDQYQFLKLVYSDSLSSFFHQIVKQYNRGQRSQWGASWGASDTPRDAPMLFTMNAQC